MSRLLSIDELETLTPDQIWELFHDAIRRYSPDCYPQVQYIKNLITAGCPINPRQIGGISALHYAVIYKFREIIEVLLSLGVDINAKSAGGWTAWDAASEEIREVFPEMRPT